MHDERLIGACTYAALDFESAGAEKGQTDQPVQIGVARASGLDGVPELWVSYISPGRPVLWSASQVHGITTEDLKGAPSLMALWPQVNRLLGGAVMIGHNLGTERRYLRAFPGHGFGPWIDTLALSRECLPGLENYSLHCVAESLGVGDSLRALVPSKRWHDALFDAAASWLIFKTIVDELNLKNSPLECLGCAIKH